MTVLIDLLRDTNTDVLYAVGIALGHRADCRAVPSLIQLADHSSARVRLGVVHGLNGQDHKDAVGTLIRLASDSDRDVRDWATFALGSQTELDTPAIRDALRANLDDSDHEIRGEALVGLARRRDPDAVNAVLREWEDFPDGISILSLEAAELLADPQLVEPLACLRGEMEFTDDDCFRAAFDDAIAACRGAVAPCGQRLARELPAYRELR